MNYFKPLRRKIGVVTLMAAMFLAAWWVRSLYIVDVLHVSRPTVISALRSICGTLQWAMLDATEKYQKESQTPPTQSPIRLVTYAVSDKVLNRRREPWPDEFCLRWSGCEFFSGSKDLVQQTGLAVPYSHLALPLTLLSTWLLLSKPRSEKVPTESSPKAEP